MNDDANVPVMIRLPKSLKHRVAVAAAREGVSVNQFVQNVLGHVCPPDNPILDEAQTLAAMARAFDADSPASVRRAAAQALREQIARLDRTIQNAPIKEPWED